MNSNEKRAEPHPDSWEEWEGLHRDLPRWRARFVKMDTNPNPCGLAKEQIAPQLLSGVAACRMEM